MKSSAKEEKGDANLLDRLTVCCRARTWTLSHNITTKKALITVGVSQHMAREMETVKKDYSKLKISLLLSCVSMLPFAPVFRPNNTIMQQPSAGRRRRASSKMEKIVNPFCCYLSLLLSYVADIKKTQNRLSRLLPSFCGALSTHFMLCRAKIIEQKTAALGTCCQFNFFIVFFLSSLEKSQHSVQHFSPFLQSILDGGEDDEHQKSIQFHRRWWPREMSGVLLKHCKCKPWHDRRNDNTRTMLMTMKEVSFHFSTEGRRQTTASASEHRRERTHFTAAAIVGLWSV